jgi:competence protein ComEC
MPGDEGALLAGILYGDRGLSKESADAFRHAGMTHLIAVSGSNISIVVGLFVPVFVALGYRRRSAILLSGGGIFLFTLFAGASASVVRAAIMGWIALLARFVGRKANAMHLLLLAGSIMVAFDPWALAFDAGFALSFLATWGLIAWSSDIADMLPWIPKTFGLRDIVGTTMAATLTTAPYLLWAFQSTSLAGLVTNLFAIPLVGFAMAAGAFALVFGPWIPWFSLPALGCLKAMLIIAEFSMRFPWLQVSLQLPTWGLFLCYAGIVAFWHVRAAGKRHYPQIDEGTFEKSPLARVFVRPF